MIWSKRKSNPWHCRDRPAISIRFFPLVLFGGTNGLAAGMRNFNSASNRLVDHPLARQVRELPLRATCLAKGPDRHRSCARLPRTR